MSRLGRAITIVVGIVAFITGLVVGITVAASLFLLT